MNGLILSLMEVASIMFGICYLSENTSAMLKPGGRIVHNEAAVIQVPILCCLPSGFCYYAVNNFTDCKVYVFAGRSLGKHGLFGVGIYFTGNLILSTILITSSQCKA